MEMQKCDTKFYTKIKKFSCVKSQWKRNSNDDKMNLKTKCKTEKKIEGDSDGLNGRILIYEQDFNYNNRFGFGISDKDVTFNS